MPCSQMLKTSFGVLQVIENKKKTFRLGKFRIWQFCFHCAFSHFQPQYYALSRMPHQCIKVHVVSAFSFAPVLYSSVSKQMLPIDLFLVQWVHTFLYSSPFEFLVQEYTNVIPLSILPVLSALRDFRTCHCLRHEACNGTQMLLRPGPFARPGSFLTQNSGKQFITYL